MSGIEEAIYSALTAHAGLSALVGDRVYPMVLPEGAVRPAVTYMRISGARDLNINQTSVDANPRYQFDVWADSFESAYGAAAQLVEAVATVESGSGVTVYGVAVVGDMDIYEPQTLLYRRVTDVQFLYAGAGV